MTKLLYLTIFSFLTFSNSIYAFSHINNESEALSKQHDCIYLIGEKHDELLDIDQKDLLLHLANEEKIILAIEGLSQDENENNNHLFGLEETYMKQIINGLKYWGFFLFRFQQKKIFEIGIESPFLGADEYDLNFIISIIENYFNDVLLRTKYPKEIQLLIPQLTKNKVLKNIRESKFDRDLIISNFFGKNSIDDNFYNNLTDNYLDWHELFKRIVAYWQNECVTSSCLTSELLFNISNVIIDYENIYTAINHSKDNPSFLVEILLNLLKIHKKLDKFALELRNEIFLPNICDAFNKTQSSKKPFFVLVGLEHVPYLEKELSKKGYNVKINDKAKLHQLEKEL